MADRTTRKTVTRLTLLAIGMFGFGFAMWPIYNVFCDLTGLGGKGVKIATQAPMAMAPGREIKIRFDATVNSALPWQFQPVKGFDRVKVGEMSKAMYLALNQSSESIIGRATYNVTPPEASLYFVKTECFCFTQQILAGNESREMPVFYYIQPDLPEYIREITLSYTFYRQAADQSMANLQNPTTASIDSQEDE